jgi:hypothetical protein
MTVIQRWVIRVVTVERQHEGEPAQCGITGFIEALRHAGLVKFHGTNEGGGLTFDLLPPEPHVTLATTKAWAESNATRMQTFGFNAVAAPEWRS